MMKYLAIITTVTFLFTFATTTSAAGGKSAKGTAKGTRKGVKPGKPTAAKVIQTLQQARPLIEDLIVKNERLVPLFVRMGFHDCITKCDGCIDLKDPNNFGLGIPIDALRPLVKKFATPATGVSRADFWAFAAIVASDVAPHGGVTETVNFTMNWFGRVDCEKANKKCFNAQGKKVPCSAEAGPYRPTPSTNFGTKQTFDYFATEFNFTEDDTVTIMGMHNLGHLAKKNSGIDIPNGWITNQTYLQNEYYQALLGGPPGALAPDSDKAALSPPWIRTLEKNNGKPFPDRNYWSTLFMNRTFAMLNPDIAIVRDLNAKNTNPNTGAVSCAFNNYTGSPVCPLAATIGLAAHYSLDSTFWLKSLKPVWDRMLSNGYDRVPCNGEICPLG